MTLIEIINPVFRAIIDQNRHTVSKETRAAMDTGWFPVGEMAQKGREWVQVMMREGILVEKVEPADEVNEAPYIFGVDDYPSSSCSDAVATQAVGNSDLRAPATAFNDPPVETKRPRGNPNWGKKRGDEALSKIIGKVDSA